MADNPAQQLGDNKKSAASNFLNMMTHRVFERVIRGNIRYEKDLRELERYREQAKKLDDVYVEGSIINALAVLNSIAGRIEAGFSLFAENYERFEEVHKIDGMALTLMNQGFGRMIQTRHEEALALYDQGIDLLEHSEEGPLAYPHRYGHLLGNKLEALVAMNQYEEAYVLYDKIESISQVYVEATRIEYARTMVDVHTSMVEVEIRQGHLEQANIHLNAALKLANDLDLSFELANVYFVGRLLALQEQDEGRATKYMREAFNQLATVEEMPHTARLYLAEARRLAKFGYTDDAKTLANKALDVFHKKDMPEDTALTEAFLGDL